MSNILFPVILGTSSTIDTLVVKLQVPADLAYFDGHFDQIAIVPGVVQIQWAEHFARQYLPIAKCFTHMEAVKFKELLLPDQTVELHLQCLDSGHKLSFCYRSATAEYSSGRLYFQ